LTVAGGAGAFPRKSMKKPGPRFRSRADQSANLPVPVVRTRGSLCRDQGREARPGKAACLRSAGFGAFAPQRRVSDCVVTLSKPWQTCDRGAAGCRNFLVRWEILLRQLMTSLLVLLATPALADNQSVSNAFALCKVIDGTGMTSKPCEVGGWTSTVNATVDMSSGEARKVCAQISGLMREKGLQFEGGWTLQIASPYSNGSIAFCALPEMGGRSALIRLRTRAAGVELKLALDHRSRRQRPTHSLLGVGTS
jgi:hypothetical protein